MSTRCQIGIYRSEDQDIKNPDVLLYRHSDGYPGKVDGSEYGVLTDLVPFLKKFQEARGLSDIEYCGAWLIHHLIDLHVEHTKEFLKEFKMASLPLDGKDFLGHGICKEFHWDIDYLYKITPTKLEVYEVHGVDEQIFEKIETIELV